MEGTMGRRSVLLVAALVVAALGTTMVFFYVNGVNDRALAKQNPERVLVAQKLIPAGTSVSDAIHDGSFASKTISSGDAIAGAISDFPPINGKTASTTIYPGDQITRVKFSAQGPTSTLVPPSGLLSISVVLKDPAQVAGFVTIGTKIAIFFTGPAARGGQDQTQLLLPDVEVLAIGAKTAAPVTTTTTTGTETNAVSNTSLTLAVDQKDFQRVLFASTHGQLNLGLLGKGFTPSLNVPPTGQTNLFD
jgi:pilus assembly protein CpaB